MGNGIVNGSVGSVCSVDYMDPKHSGIISSRMLAGSRLLAHQEEVRRMFLSYLSSKAWMRDLLDGYSHSNVEPSFRMPPGKTVQLSAGVGPSRLHQNRESFSSARSSFSSCSVNSSAINSLYGNHRKKINHASIPQTQQPEQAHFVGIHSLLLNSSMTGNRNKVPILLIAAVLPIFLVSTNFHLWLDTAIKNYADSGNHKLFHELCAVQTPPPKRYNYRENVRKSKPGTSFSFLSGNLHHDSSVADDAIVEVRAGKISQEKNEGDTEVTVTMVNNCTSTESVNLDSYFTQQHMIPYDDNDVGSLEEAIDRALQSLSMAAVDSLLQKEGWLREFVSFIEDLPFCITVASATELGIHGQRYPLIYVNEAFENLTQYARKELIGQNCRLLQSDSVSELHQIELMRSALHEKRAIRLAITNVRKDGSTFLNFLGMMPIINRFGEYTHVLGVQYKLEGHEETCSEDFVVGNDLLRLLPSLIY